MGSRRLRALVYLAALFAGIGLAQIADGDGLPDIASMAPRLPRIELPSIDLPSIDLPRVELPSVELPRIELPRFELGAKSSPVRPSSPSRPTAAAPAPALAATARPRESAIPAALDLPAEMELPPEPLANDSTLAPAPAPALTPIERSLGAAYKDGMILTGSTEHRIILFTFDDGPDPATTPLLLDRLDEAGIKAIFFLVADRIEGKTPMERRQAVIAREIVRRGHIVGGHTVNHVQLPLLDDDTALYEITHAEEIFQKVLGARPFLFRPPFGAHSQRIDQHLAGRHYTSVLWNVGAGDFQVRTADDVYATWVKVFERREREDGDRGGIVLLHDTHPWSVDAFERIVSYLLRRNCELNERGEELFDFVDDLDFFYVPRGDSRPEEEAPRLVVQPELIAARQALLRERTARRCRSLASAF